MAQNGRLPDSALSSIPGGRLAQGGPARSWIAMRYYIGRKHGVWLSPTGPNSSYRSYAKQVEFWNAYQAGRGALAARPGTSNHGWGKAVDIPTAQMQQQVRKYGHLFGWGIAGGVLSSDAPSESWHCTWRKKTPMANTWYWRYRWAVRRKKRRRR